VIKIIAKTVIRRMASLERDNWVFTAFEILPKWGGIWHERPYKHFV